MRPRHRVLLLVPLVLVGQSRKGRSGKRQRISGGVRLVKAVEPERIFIPEFVIDAVEILVVGRNRSRIEQEVVVNAWIGREWNKLSHQLNRQRVQVCRGNNAGRPERVVGSARRARCTCPVVIWTARGTISKKRERTRIAAKPATRNEVRIFAKISAALGCCVNRNGRYCPRLRNSLVIPLIREKEKGMILINWSSVRADVFILMERIGGRFEVVLRIQESVAIELERAAVELIGAVLDVGVDDGSRVASVFRIQST